MDIAISFIGKLKWQTVGLYAPWLVTLWILFTQYNLTLRIDLLLLTKHCCHEYSNEMQFLWLLDPEYTGHTASSRCLYQGSYFY